MRILRVAQKVYPDAKGGGAYHVHAMSRDQAAMGHDVTVLTVGDGPSREKRDGYTLVRRSALIEPLGNAVSPGVARYLQQTDEFDVVHAHSHLYASTNMAAFARRFGDTKLAITNHGLYSQTAPEWVFKAYLMTIGKLTFDSADVVFCYTDTDRERVRSLGVSSRIEVVSNGIDTERFTPEGPESDLINTDGPVVLFVGRFVKGKRPTLVLESFAEIIDEYPDAELYLCGEGPLCEELDSSIRDLEIQESTTFLGQVPYEEMPGIYRSADVLILPSRAEGVPRTVLEAMASGVRPVVSDLEQIVDVVGHYGWNVSKPTSDGFAAALSEALSKPGSDFQGREQVLKEHQWESTVERTTEILASL